MYRMRYISETSTTAGRLRRTRRRFRLALVVVIALVVALVVVGGDGLGIRRGFGVHRGFGVCLGLGVRRGGFRARRQVLQHVGERSLERFFVMNEKIIILPLILLQVVVAGRRFVLDLALALRGSDG